MERSPAPDYERAEQWLADFHEDLNCNRYPTYVTLRRVVVEAAQRAQSMARLEHELQRLR